jgi:hypothetical protein
LKNSSKDDFRRRPSNANQYQQREQILPEVQYQRRPSNAGQNRQVQRRPSGSETEQKSNYYNDQLKEKVRKDFEEILGLQQQVKEDLKEFLAVKNNSNVDPFSKQSRSASNDSGYEEGLKGPLKIKLKFDEAKYSIKVERNIEFDDLVVMISKQIGIDLIGQELGYYDNEDPDTLITIFDQNDLIIALYSAVEAFTLWISKDRIKIRLNFSGVRSKIKVSRHIDLSVLLSMISAKFKLDDISQMDLGYYDEDDQKLLISIYDQEDLRIALNNGDNVSNLYLVNQN